MTTSDDRSPAEAPSTARNVTLTAAGLLILAAGFTFAVPRRAEIAAAMAPPLALEVPAEMPDMEPAPPETAVAPPAAVTKALPSADAASASEAVPPPPAAAGTATAAGTARAAGDAGSAPVVRTEVLTRPIAIDTATFLVGRARVKLDGVEPPAAARRCEAGGGRTWPCGAKARTALRAWLRARSIRCEVPEDFARSASTTTSRCVLGDKDVGEWLVENGWSAARPGGPYEALEAKARANRLGLWGDG